MSQEMEYLAGTALDTEDSSPVITLRVYELGAKASGLMVPNCVAHLPGGANGLIINPPVLEWAGAIEQTDGQIPDNEDLNEVARMGEPEVFGCMGLFIEQFKPVRRPIICKSFARVIIEKSSDGILGFVLQAPLRIQDSSIEDDPTLHTGFYL